MIILSFFETFYQNILGSTWLEAFAATFGLLSVWYARKANILVYPTGIISVLIYVYICYFAMLYADMGINFFYFVMSVYGWIMWTRKDHNQQKLSITRNTARQQWITVLATVAFYFAILGLIWVFKKDDPEYMNSYVPYVDSFTTAVFLIAMLLMARKKVENWIYWIIGDVVSVPLYMMKGLVLTSFQYFIFLILAIMGLIEWSRMYRQQQKA